MTEKKFIYVIDGEVCGGIQFSIDGPEDIVLAEIISSNTPPVEVPIDVEVLIGWVYNGKTFDEPK